MTTANYSESDYNSVVEFLADLYQRDPEHPYWLPSRWEYATYLVCPLHLRRGMQDWKNYIRLWKDGDKIVGLALTERPDENMFFMVHPEYRSLEDEMITWAEANVPADKIQIWTREGDVFREKLLEKRGYSCTKPYEYLNWRVLENYTPLSELPAEYTFHSLDDDKFWDSKIDCTAKAFGSEKVTREIYTFMQSAPSYDRSLDLYIVYKDMVVSMCIIWLDTRDDLGYFEPVATHPDFQGKGLGKALLNYGMKLLKNRGIAKAYVGAYGDDRKAFYYKSGFTSSVTFRPWKKKL